VEEVRVVVAGGGDGGERGLTIAIEFVIGRRRCMIGRIKVVRCYPQVCDWCSFAFYEVALQEVVLDVQVGYRTPDLKVN
jgi:hypothetical protein